MPNPNVYLITIYIQCVSKKASYTLESSTAARLNLNGLTLMSHALILAEQISINFQYSIKSFCHSVLRTLGLITQPSPWGTVLKSPAFVLFFRIKSWHTAIMGDTAWHCRVDLDQHII